MNGRQLDILLNPCGVPSRMNIGQNFEAYLSFIAYLLDVYIESDPFNGATKGDIKLLMRYVWEREERLFQLPHATFYSSRAGDSQA